MSEANQSGSPTSSRTTVRRLAKRAEYRPEEIRVILRAGTLAHVGVMTDEGPLVLPMVYGIDDDTMYLHGAIANSLLGAGADHEICATVTIVDGLVFAKTPFNHSMNYRSVVVRGRARIIAGEDEARRALRIITDHIVPTWDTLRPPTANDIRATRVVALPLAEMSAKIRSGGAGNFPEDENERYWTGHVPVSMVVGAPVTNVDAHVSVPDAIAALSGTDLHSRQTR
ncbi:MAG: flavin-nucleotide-binding protein [Acidimicrobiales bacterium mtb01]|nr:pyridoxamine 5'-phosphate oxidase family protein [Actinomycetota bacterium]TEX47389.1 MAG: flavin-nucleotide-binding protein [Acidimicrobiales bacterium mtb01]